MRRNIFPIIFSICAILFMITSTYSVLATDYYVYPWMNTSQSESNLTPSFAYPWMNISQGSISKPFEKYLANLSISKAFAFPSYTINILSNNISQTLASIKNVLREFTYQISQIYSNLTAILQTVQQLLSQNWVQGTTYLVEIRLGVNTGGFDQANYTEPEPTEPSIPTATPEPISIPNIPINATALIKIILVTYSGWWITAVVAGIAFVAISKINVKFAAAVGLGIVALCALYGIIPYWTIIIIAGIAIIWVVKG